MVTDKILGAKGARTIKVIKSINNAADKISEKQKEESVSLQTAKISNLKSTSKKSDTGRVSIFNLEDASNVNKELQKEADTKLNEISNGVISKCNKRIAITKTASILGASTAAFLILAKGLSLGAVGASVTAGVFIALASFGILGLVQFFGGNKKRRASYTKYAASVENKSTLDFSNAPKPDTDIIESAGQTFFGSKNREPLTKKEIKTAAKEELNNTHSRGIYVTYPQNDGQKADNILITEGEINSEEYTGISTENGITTANYQIPAEFADFSQKYLNTDTKLTDKQADKFIKITKALQTDGIYTKKDKDSIEEDADIFDLSGDGHLNYGDICAINLHVAKKNYSAQQKKILSDKNNWDANKLSKLLGMDQNQCFELFDLNGDDNIDEKDFVLYHNLENHKAKADINADGNTDEQDADLMKHYFKAIIKRYKNKGKLLKNTIEIMGGEDRMQILKDHFEMEEHGIIIHQNTL